MSTYSSSNPYESPQDVETYDQGKLAETAQLLGATRPWVLMFGVVSIILAGLCGIGTIGVAFMMLMPNGAVFGAVAAAFYVMLAVFYAAIGIVLCRFAMATGEFRQTLDLSVLNKALRSHKSFWKIAGIGFLVFIVMYVAMIVVVLATGFAFTPNGPMGNPAPFEFNPEDFEVEEP